jgi:hypothetical protein
MRNQHGLVGLYGSRPWTPARIPGLVAWYRGDRGITLNIDGGHVVTWADQSGHGNDLTQATAIKQPSYITGAVNGHPALRFDGSAQFLQTAAFTLNQPFTVALVLKMITVGASLAHDAVMDGNTAGSTTFGVDTTPRTVAYAGSTVLDPVAEANGSYARIVAIYDGASSALRVAGAVTASGAIGANNAGGLTLGALADGTRPTNIECAELLAYSHHLTASELAALERSLQKRYALP